MFGLHTTQLSQATHSPLYTKPGYVLIFHNHNHLSEFRHDKHICVFHLLTKTFWYTLLHQSISPLPESIKALMGPPSVSSSFFTSIPRPQSYPSSSPLLAGHPPLFSFINKVRSSHFLSSPFSSWYYYLHVCVLVIRKGIFI